MLTRRALLRRAAAGALAAGLIDPRAMAAAPERVALRKLVSLGGSTVHPGSTNDYLHFSNREDVRATGTTWVKIWLAWADVQGTVPRPATVAQSWDQLGAGGLANIDAQVRAANRDGVGVILCVESSYPAWAINPPGRPVAPPPRGFEPQQRTPYELGVDSPFGWFVGHLMARYRAGVARNPAGPRAGARGFTYGNPLGGFANAIEVCNEPNLTSWPQAVAPARAAAMMRTADAWSARLLGPAVLGPAVADTVARSSEAGTEWSAFTAAVLDELEGWSPRGLVGFSWHNYSDMREGTADRTRRLLDTLERRGWRDDLVWITEGGYDLTRHGTPQTLVTASELRLQARAIERGFAACAALARERAGRIRPHTFAQHTVNDSHTNSFKSGLRADVAGTLPGAHRPAWRAWRDLPAYDGV